MVTRGSSSNVIGTKLLEWLGIPVENCVKASIVVEVDCPVMVTAEYIAFEGHCSKALVASIRKYRLEEINEGE